MIVMDFIEKNAVQLKGYEDDGTDMWFQVDPIRYTHAEPPIQLTIWENGGMDPFYLNIGEAANLIFLLQKAIDDLVASKQWRDDSNPPLDIVFHG